MEPRPMTPTEQIEQLIDENDRLRNELHDLKMDCADLKLSCKGAAEDYEQLHQAYLELKSNTVCSIHCNRKIDQITIFFTNDKKEEE